MANGGRQQASCSICHLTLSLCHHFLQIDSMKLAYANARFRPTAHDGANAHVRQFVQNAVALGHEVWMWPGVAHPLARALPDGRLARLSTLREMDVVYVRLENDPAKACGWAT